MQLWVGWRSGEPANGPSRKSIPCTPRSHEVDRPRTLSSRTLATCCAEHDDAGRPRPAGTGPNGNRARSLSSAAPRLLRIWLVDLASVRPTEDVAAETARVLGIRGMAPDATIDVVRRYLAERDMLLLLDNCEHVLDVCASSTPCSAPVRIFLSQPAARSAPAEGGVELRALSRRSPVGAQSNPSAGGGHGDRRHRSASSASRSPKSTGPSSTSSRP